MTGPQFHQRPQPRMIVLDDEANPLLDRPFSTHTMSPTWMCFLLADSETLGGGFGFSLLFDDDHFFNIELQGFPDRR
jgi:hypothetical protein